MKRILGFLALSLCMLSCSKGAVTITEDAQTYTLSNGIVSAMVAKESGDLVSYKFNGKELLATRVNEQGEPDLVLDPPGANPNGLNRGMTDHQYGFWSHDAMGPRGTGDAIATVTIDPAKNRGKRAEVSIKGIAEGRKMGTGPGASPQGQFAADVEIRFAIEDGASEIYTYCIFTHPESYPASALGEARFCAKLAPMFDWMTVDKDVDFYYPATHFAGDKYVYTANLHNNQVFGWASTTENIGFYLINPSMEYISGGPTKVEFMGHRDTNKAAAPCVLNYWRSSHYGGSSVTVEEGEFWQKVIGPFVLYVNEGGSHEELYADAKARAEVHKEAWPYKWVDSPAYASSKQRADVSGKIVLDDPITPSEFSNLRVGLARSGYFWQKDAKNYQFWTVAEADGRFCLEGVVPGSYTLYAFADGVLGEYVQADIEVAEGKDVKLGEIVWQPVRKGEQVFEIGIADRSAKEFAMGDRYRDPEIVLSYAKEFPEDVRFVYGQSDYSKDWPYLHVPHNEAENVKVMPFFGVMGEGRATPYTICFNLDEAPAENAIATLRLGICGTASEHVYVSANGQELGEVPLTQTRDGLITRHGSHGIWYETDFTFAASALTSGANELTLTLPAGSLNSGMVYDYIRLEIL